MITPETRDMDARIADALALFVAAIDNTTDLACMKRDTYRRISHAPDCRETTRGRTCNCGRDTLVAAIEELLREPDNA